MLYATRNDFGNCFIHIISHFSQDTAAIHLTLVRDPSIHVRGSNAHGKWNTQLFVHIISAKLPHRQEPFVAHWNRQVGWALFAPSKTQSSCARHSMVGITSHQSSVWPRKSPLGWALQQSLNKSKREPQQAADGDFHNSVRKELTTESVLRIREIIIKKKKSRKRNKKNPA